MANLVVKDGAAATKYLKATGAGSDIDPTIPEHLDTNSAAILAALQAIQTAAAAIQVAVETLDNIVAGTEAQVDIVTSALPTGAATAANQATLIAALAAQLAELQLKADLTETQPVSLASAPTTAVTGPLTNTELRNTAVPVSVATLPALAAGTNNVGDVDVASVTLPTVVYNGKTTVTTAGTQVALAASQAIVSGVTIKATAANTGIIYVGDLNVASTTGYPLAAGDTVFLEIANLATVFVDSSVSGETCAYVAT